MAERQLKRDIRTKALACIPSMRLNNYSGSGGPGIEPRLRHGLASFPGRFLRRRGKTAGAIARPQARGRDTGRTDKIT